MARRSTFGSVEALPSGRFRARYAVGPNAWHPAPTTFTTRGEANAWLARERVRLEQQAAGSPRAAVRSRPPVVNDYARAWLADRDVRPSTRRTYESYLRIHVEPTQLGRERLDAVTPTMVRDWFRSAAPGHPTMRARTYAMLKTIFGTAVAEDLIVANPCRVVGGTQTHAATEVEVLTPAQVAALAAEMGPDWAAAVYLGAYAQLRVGEVLALRRRDVDLEAGVVHVTRSATSLPGRVVIGKPKTDAGVRTVALPAAVVGVLREHLARRPSAPSALLFEGTDRGVPPRTQTFSDRVKRAARRADLPPAFRFHHLRHTGLTMLAEAGASVAELQARAGHTTPAMALRYQHARAERDRALADSLRVDLG